MCGRSPPLSGCRVSRVDGPRTAAGPTPHVVALAPPPSQCLKARWSARRAGPCVVLVDDLLRDATSRGHLEAFGRGPLPYGLVLLPVGRRGASAAARGLADAAASGDELRQRVTQRRGVLLGEVDLVLGAVERELHGFVRVAAVEVVGQVGDCPQSHRFSFSLRIAVIQAIAITVTRADRLVRPWM